MRLRSVATLAAFAVGLASPLRAQKGLIDLTADALERWLNGAKTEKTETAKVDGQVAEQQAKIKKFRDCKIAFETAGEVSGSRLGGLAARMAIRAKCGATSEDDMVKDLQKIYDGPVNAGAKTAGMKRDEYANLKERLLAYMYGDRSGFTKGGLDVLGTRTNDLSSVLGVSFVQAGAPAGGAVGGGGGRATMNVPGVWTTDYAWEYIGYMFAMEYGSGAGSLEKEYQPGEWTRWTITDGSGKTTLQTIERAYLAKMVDGSEWWRFKTTAPRDDNGKQVSDTLVLEAQFKNDNPYYKTLVRMRGKLPGTAEAQEMMVPAGFATVGMGAVFQTRPTPESIEGATVGTEAVTIGGSSLQAKHVKFGIGGGTLEWWLSDQAPGGWLKFLVTAKDTPGYKMEMVEKGTGAKSELGVKF